MNGMGYSLYGEFTACSSQCTDCRGGDCYECQSGYGVWNSDCTACPSSGKYLDGKKCKSCSSNCVTCSDGSTCTDCANGYIVQANACVACSAGTYKSGVSTCSPCSGTCATCTSLTACQSCTAGYALLSPNSVCSTCPNGQYPSNSACSNCPATCSQCSSASVCSTCKPGYALIGTMCSTCPGGTYLDATQTCTNCPGTCASCSSSTVCSTCNANYALIGTMCDTCPFGTFLSSQSCITCPGTCASCVSNSNCSTCKAGYGLVGGQCVTCPSGTYLNAQNCVTCPSTCDSCTSASSCTTCKAGFALPTGGGVCDVCPTGTYLSGQSCLPCTSTCSACSSSSVCSTCQAGYGLIGTMCSACPSGTYLNGQNCITCPSPCSQCSSASVCSACQAGYALIGTMCSTCPTGTYLNAAQTCSNCPGTCASCSSASICSTCQAGYGLINTMCNTCPTGTYLSGQSCLTCAGTCSECTSSSVCTVCKSGYALPTGGGICNVCPTGTYLSGQSCLQCSNTCTACSSSSVCSACSAGYGLQGSSCAVCPSGTFLYQGLCPDCPGTCSSCTDSNTCTACQYGYVLINDQCGSCPPGTFYSEGICMSSPYTNTTGDIIGAGQAATKAASQIASLLSSGSPAGISAGVSGKIFSNIKFLNITYSDELEQALLSWNKSLISVGFDMNLPGTVDHMLKNEPLPYNFEKYDVRSSFLANNWQNIFMLLMILGIYVLARGLQWLAKAKNYKYLKYSLVRAVRVMIQNFFLAQLYGVYGDLIFFCVLDWRSVDKSVSLSDISVTISCFMMIVLIVNMILHYKFVKKYQRIRIKALETKNQEELENFRRDNEGNQVLFRDFRDKTPNQQLFLFYFTIRDLLFSLILTTLFDHPIVQTVMVLLLTLGMFVYLFVRRPFEETSDFLQQIVNELVTITVAISVFAQAIMDRMGISAVSTRVRLGKTIILLNIIFNYISLAFMLWKLLLIVRDGYLAYKNYKEKKKLRVIHSKVYPLGSISQRASFSSSTQLSLEGSSALEGSPAFLPRGRMSSSLTVDSFIRELAEDLANPDYINNLGAPRNLLRNSSLQQSNTDNDESQSQLRIISLDTERPLVTKREESKVVVKPAAPLFTVGFHPYQSTTAALGSSEIVPESRKNDQEDDLVVPNVTLKKVTSDILHIRNKVQEKPANLLIKSLKTPVEMITDYLNSFKKENGEKKASLREIFSTNNNKDLSELKLGDGGGVDVKGDEGQKKEENDVVLEDITYEGDKRDVVVEIHEENNKEEEITSEKLPIEVEVSAIAQDI